MAKKSVYLISFSTENTRRYNNAVFFFFIELLVIRVRINKYHLPPTVYILYMHLHSIHVRNVLEVLFLD